MMLRSLSAALLICAAGGHAIAAPADSAAVGSATPSSGRHVEAISYEAEAIVNAGSGDFAPYYIASNNHGLLTQNAGTLLRIGAVRPLDLDRRFSYSYGAELLGGWTSAVDYERFNPEINGWTGDPRRPSAVSLRQLFGEVKYRSLFLSVGMKARNSALLSHTLSSGDLTESGNARPIPQVRVGFIDFRDIPFTNGWVQIQGEIAYGKMADNGWMKDHYNYFNWHINLGGLYHYKRCYFRTKPSMPLSVTVGMQTAAMFGGTTSFYVNGAHVRSEKYKVTMKTLWDMFLPIRGEGSAYYEGNTLGSWDVMFRYRFGNGSQVRFYVEKPWEDGSGIGWLNGFDGVWGLEYRAAEQHAFVSGAVVEYIDFTNQSGPIHWAPGDVPGTTLTGHASGGDMYYNNHQSNSYMNYGMSIGTPFLPAPVYNRDGYMAYVHNRIRGFHAGVEGEIVPALRYRLLGSYRKGWGDSRIPVAKAADCVSLMLEATYTLPRVPALNLQARLALDRGTLLGDNLGASLSARYTGNLTLGK